jgi:hypothetical protein
MQKDPDPQSIDAALDWHTAIVDSVLAHRAATLAAFHTGAQRIASAFFGMTYADIDAFFVAERAEVDAQAIVTIIAAAEAAIRADYRERVQDVYRDALSQAYLELHHKLPNHERARPPFDEGGILEKLKDSGTVQAHVVTQFRDMLRQRHWIAHGRYWLLNLAANYHEPEDVHAAASVLLAALSA